MCSAILWLFELFCSALWLYNILVVYDVTNCGRLRDSLGHREHIYIWFSSTLLYWQLLINETNPYHVLKNSVAVNGLNLKCKCACFAMYSLVMSFCSFDFIMTSLHDHVISS